MKFTWGTGIALTLTAFVLAMAFAVYKVMQQDYDLVTTDYYEQELIYQQKIDQKNNALSLGEAVKLEPTVEGVFIGMPEKLKGQVGDLEIEMYCVTDDELDFLVSEPGWTADDLSVKHSNLKSGKWIAKITFIVGETGYYFEPDIYLP